MKKRILVLFLGIFGLVGCGSGGLFPSANSTDKGDSKTSKPDGFYIELDYLSKKDTSKQLSIVAANNSSFTNSNGVVTISRADEYTISGYFKGAIKVSVDGVTLVLDNAYLENDGSAAVSYTLDEKNTGVKVSAKEGTSNYIVTTNTSGKKDKGSSIFSEKELTFDGAGTLTVVGGGNHGAKAGTVKMHGTGNFYFQGSKDGSAINCNKYKHKAEVDGNVYLINSKNGIKADEVVDILSGKYTFYNTVTAIKTEVDPFDDDGVTPVERHITLEAPAEISFASVTDKFVTIEGKLTNTAKNTDL